MRSDQIIAHRGNTSPGDSGSGVLVEINLVGIQQGNTRRKMAMVLRPNVDGKATQLVQNGSHVLDAKNVVYGVLFGIDGLMSTKKAAEIKDGKLESTAADLPCSVSSGEPENVGLGETADTSSVVL